MSLKDNPGGWVADLGCGIVVAFVFITIAALLLAPLWKRILG